MKRIGLLVALVALLVLTAGACGDDADEASDETTAPPTTADTTTSVPAGDAVAVRVYFARDEYVATAGRTVEAPGVDGLSGAAARNPRMREPTLAAEAVQVRGVGRGGLVSDR